MNCEIKLGDKVKCLISGFIGIVETKTECLNGCLRYGMVETFKKGVRNEFRTLEVDSQQVVRIDGGLNKVKEIKKTKTGGRMKFGKL